MTKCDKCRFNPNNSFYDNAGGDCGGCENDSHFMPKKRIIPHKCKLCQYRNDPCHYLCVECQDALNFTAKKKRIIQKPLRIKKKMKKINLESF